MSRRLFETEEEARAWVDSEDWDGGDNEETGSNTLDTTIDEWRLEMEKTNIGDPGMTARELARELYPQPIPVSTMRNRLDRLIAKKKCTRGIGRRIGVGGVFTVTVYQLTKEKK